MCNTHWRQQCLEWLYGLIGKHPRLGRPASQLRDTGPSNIYIRNTGCDWAAGTDMDPVRTIAEASARLPAILTEQHVIIGIPDENGKDVHAL